MQMDETPIWIGQHPGKPSDMKKGYFSPSSATEARWCFPWPAPAGTGMRPSSSATTPGPW